MPLSLPEEPVLHSRHAPLLPIRLEAAIRAVRQCHLAGAHFRYTNFLHKTYVFFFRYIWQVRISRIC